MTITQEDIEQFTRHLIAVPFQGSECWFYAPIGRSDEQLAFSTVDYATATCNGEQVNAHRFAYAAAHPGTVYSDLGGWDIHHTKGCIGYRCQNPEHLEKTEMREHRATRGVSGSLIKYQIRLMESAIGKTLPEGRERTLGGVTFKIRGAVVDSIIREEWSTPTFEVVDTSTVL